MLMRKPNKVRQKLAAGRVVTGTAIYSGAPNMVKARTEEALSRTCEAARATGKHVMFGVGLQDEAIEARIAQGVTMLELSHDVVILRNTPACKVADFGDRPSGR